MQDDTSNQAGSNATNIESDLDLNAWRSAYAEQHKGTHDHDENEMLICELFAHLCGAAAYYSNEKTDYYDDLERDLIALRHIHLHMDPRVYARAKRYALKLQDPQSELCFLWANPPAYPTEFKLSEEEERSIDLLLQSPGIKRYVDSLRAVACI